MRGLDQVFLARAGGSRWERRALPCPRALVAASLAQIGEFSFVLAQSGVTLAVAGSRQAHARNRSSQSLATTVSLFSSTYASAGHSLDAWRRQESFYLA